MFNSTGNIPYGIFSIKGRALYVQKKDTEGLTAVRISKP